MALYQSVLQKHLDSNWDSILKDTRSWDLLRDQGFLLLQSLVNNHLQETIKFHCRVPGDDDQNDSLDLKDESSTVDALDRIINRMKILIQKMQKSFVQLQDLKNSAIDRAQDLTRFCYRDCMLDDWSKILY
jgi:hypothetical protein